MSCHYSIYRVYFFFGNVHKITLMSHYNREELIKDVIGVPRVSTSSSSTSASFRFANSVSLNSQEEAVSNYSQQQESCGGGPCRSPLTAQPEGEQVEFKMRRFILVEILMHILMLCCVACMCFSFRKDLQWILVNTYVPSLIQEGPQ